MPDITLHLEHRLPVRHPDDDAHRPGSNLADVAALFGLGLGEEPAVTLLPPTRIPLRPHALVFITGPSGGGKSTLLRLIRRQLQQRPDAQPIDLNRLPLPRHDAAIVDAFPAVPLERTLGVLSRAGLGEAFALCRRPGELSDGQRHRLRVAAAMLAAEDVRRACSMAGERSAALPVLLADEFGATLDRVTAMVLARNLRRWLDDTPVCAVVATTHDDLLEPLHPDVLIHKGLGGEVDVLERAGAPVAQETSPGGSLGLSAPQGE